MQHAKRRKRSAETRAASTRDSISIRRFSRCVMHGVLSSGPLQGRKSQPKQLRTGPTKATSYVIHMRCPRDARAIVFSTGGKRQHTYAQSDPSTGRAPSPKLARPSIGTRSSTGATLIGARHVLVKKRTEYAQPA